MFGHFITLWTVNQPLLPTYCDAPIKVHKTNNMVYLSDETKGHYGKNTSCIPVSSIIWILFCTTCFSITNADFESYVDISKRKNETKKTFSSKVQRL